MGYLVQDKAGCPHLVRYGLYAHHFGASPLRWIDVATNPAAMPVTLGFPFLKVAAMPNLTDILETARARARQQNLPYEGALLPAEAQALLSLLPDAKIVDVRTAAEWTYVGRIADSLEIEWQTFPGGRPNASFLEQLQHAAPKDRPLLFICRSGARSHAAAAAASAVGYARCFNVLEGFEGDKDAAGHRNTVGGWRAAGLPWYQG